MSPKELLSLWVGPESQRLAHHFYWTQAEQFFEDDPCHQQVMWEMPNTQDDKPKPNMLVFDADIPQLVRLRTINHGKMIKEMEKTEVDPSMFFPVAKVNSEPSPVQSDPDIGLFTNWRSEQANYVLMDRNFSQQTHSYDFWNQVFGAERDRYQDAVRKRIERSDSLLAFTLCADEARVGFTESLLYYLREECPKVDVMFSSVEGVGFHGRLATLGHLSQETSLIWSIGAQTQPAYYGNQYDEFANIFSCIFTPFILKDTDNSSYLSSIVYPSRRLFNVAYTLPLITGEQEPVPGTNIVNYYTDRDGEAENRIRFANTSFLDFKTKTQDNRLGLLAESFMLRGYSKGIQEQYHIRTPLFHFRINEGIVALNPERNLLYSEPCRITYGEKAAEHPFHTVLYQHKCFAENLRRLAHQKTVNYMESQSEWVENIMALADNYQQLQDDSD